MSFHLRNTIKRPVVVVNLDPANEQPPYQADIDVQDIVEVDEV